MVSHPAPPCHDRFCDRCEDKYSTYVLCAACVELVPNFYALRVLQPTPVMLEKKDQIADQRYKSMMLWWMWHKGRRCGGNVDA